ncbi:hypothetical protein CMI37_15495 [Candidatus Pacearchaeota archaeon]|nr:hypothetical protein [Candidatus Pacearchaeota archaeon]|tara:strand:+ start:1269 stop:1745 length:477 start_codon:yes stop_codon:yes gene_type:complete
MILQRINRSDPEKIFIVVKNSYSTASLTNGQSVIWDWTTDADGVGVTLATATENVAAGTDFAGVAVDTIAAGAYGLLQIYGYHSAVRVRSLTSTGHVYHESRGEVAAGTRLTAGITNVFAMEGVTPAETAQILHPCGFAFAAQASYTTKAIAVFIKAL